MSDKCCDRAWSDIIFMLINIPDWYGNYGFAGELFRRTGFPVSKFNLFLALIDNCTHRSYLLKGLSRSVHGFEQILIIICSKCRKRFLRAGWELEVEVLAQILSIPTILKSKSFFSTDNFVTRPDHVLSSDLRPTCQKCSKWISTSCA